MQMGGTNKQQNAWLTVMTKRQKTVQTWLFVYFHLEYINVRVNILCNCISAYSKNMDCYSEVIHNNTLARCNHIFQSLQPLLQSVSAYLFYCHPEQTESQDVQK